MLVMGKQQQHIMEKFGQEDFLHQLVIGGFKKKINKFKNL
jgi:hypothetical protein